MIVFNGGNAAGFGSGAVQPGGGQVVGTGTGIANPGPGTLHSDFSNKKDGVLGAKILLSYYLLGGFGVALGVGGAVASPVGNFAIGQGESISIGK